MKKRKIIFAIVLLFAVLFLLFSTKAIGVQLVCLRENEKIEFSKCNSAMNDFVCGSTTCQLCVNEIRTGVYCPESPNSCNEGGGSCKYLYEQQPQQNETNKTQEKLPVITLLNPVDDYSQKEAGKIEFSFKATDSSKLEICALVLDGKAVALKSKPISLSTQKLYWTTEPGYYLWEIECTTRTGAYSEIYTISSETRTLSVGNVSEQTGGNGTNGTHFNISLVAPENRWSATGAQEVTFSYNISKSVNLSGIQECSLILNQDVVSSSNEINAANTFSYLVYLGSYSWSVKCLMLENNLTSETRNFTINSPITFAVSNSGGVSGGGGGGGCLIKWNCTEWSSCTEGNQTRTCSKENSYCYAGKKPEETRECIEASASNNTESSLENEETESKTETSSESVIQKGISGITGAVVGALDNNRVSIVVAFIIIVVFVTVLISYFTKEKKEEKR